MKRIGVLTNGRDVGGSNAAIRAIVRTAASKGIQTFGIKNGFRGLFEDHIKLITSRDVSGKIGKSSSFLGVTGTFDLNDERKLHQLMANMNKKSIDGLIAIGGSGTIASSKILADKGIPIVCIPATIQDDVMDTDVSLGVDTALNNISNSVDHIRSCDSSRNRSFLVEVEGRNTGSLAIRSAIVTGAEICLIPEESTIDLSIISKKMEDSIQGGKTQCIAIIASGWKPGTTALSNYLQEHQQETDLLVRKSILGYVQRGGSPSAFDRLLGTEFGTEAVKLLTEGVFNHYVAIQGEKIERIPITNTIGKFKPIGEEFYKLFNNTHK